MIVSKKSIPRSVQRSRVKRRVREAFRKSLTGYLLGWDIVAMTRPKINSRQDLTGYLQDAFATLAEKLK
jgi:ribonuclease P protein component